MRQEVELELQNKLGIGGYETGKLVDIIFDVEPLPKTFELIKINPYTGKAESVKLRNLSVNLKKLSIDALELGAGIAGAITMPWLIPIAALIGINKLCSGVKKQLTPEHAILLQGMWEEQINSGHILNKDVAFAMVTEKAEELKRNPISREHFEILLKDLSKLKILQVKNDKIWLIENIKFESAF